MEGTAGAGEEDVERPVGGGGGHGGGDLVLDGDVRHNARTVAPPVAAAAMRSRASTSFCSVRPQIVTWAPSAANRSAVASPMPLPPPVTRTDQPAMPVDGPVAAIRRCQRGRPAARRG